MKHSRCICSMLASGMVLSAAAQTPATPVPRHPRPRACRPRQDRRHFVPGGRGPDQRGPAQLRRPRKEVRPQAAELKNLSDEMDTLTKQLQAQGATSAMPSAARAPTRSTPRRSNWTGTRRTPRATSSRRCRTSITAWPPRCTTCCSLCGEGRLHSGSGCLAAAVAGTLRHQDHQHHQGGDRRLQREVGRACADIARCGSEQRSPSAPSAPRPAAPRPTTPQ